MRATSDSRALASPSAVPIRAASRHDAALPCDHPTHPRSRITRVLVTRLERPAAKRGNARCARSQGSRAGEARECAVRSVSGVAGRRSAGMRGAVGAVGTRVHLARDRGAMTAGIVDPLALGRRRDRRSPVRSVAARILDLARLDDDSITGRACRNGGTTQIASEHSLAAGVVIPEVADASRVRCYETSRALAQAATDPRPRTPHPPRYGDSGCGCRPGGDRASWSSW